MVIGNWVKRADRDDTKWHRVESVIESDAITKCGRRMRRMVGRFDISEVEPLTRMIGQPQNCKRCS